VFVTCYNEPPEIVEKTARAALAMDYPPTKLRVYVLDDGNSPVMRAMTERLCIEDLQSPLLQQEAARIDAELALVIERLRQLKNLAPEIQATEKWLRSPSSTKVNSSDQAISFAQHLQQLIFWLNPGARSVSEWLAKEKQLLEETITQKEQELIELARFNYIARPKPFGVPTTLKQAILITQFSLEKHRRFYSDFRCRSYPQPQFLKRVLPYFYTYNLFRWTLRAESNCFCTNSPGFL
jgi:cellulose synthase (UDP-forming)